jgi:hypothetical protein
MPRHFERAQIATIHENFAGALFADSSLTAGWEHINLTGTTSGRQTDLSGTPASGLKPQRLDA